MDKLQFEAGGFPMSVERLGTMQECWNEASEATLKFLGDTDCVISGCGTRGEQDGYILLNGHIYPHRKADIASGGTWVAVMEETVESLAYEDGEERPFRTRLYAKSFATKPADALYAVAWAAVRTLWTAYQLTTKKADLSALETAKARITDLETKIAALGSSTSADLSALARQLVPKGAVILWAGAIPVSAVKSSDVVSGLGAAYGYIPCADFTTATTAARLAWNGYFDELGLKSTARFNANASGLRFTTILRELGLPAVNLSGRMPVGTSVDFTLGSSGGEKTHTLTVDEMPNHRHQQNGTETWRLKGGSNPAQTLDNNTGTHAAGYTAYAGGGRPHNNMPPYYALNYLMKVV